MIMFLKLSNLVINTSKISSIQMYSNMYYINVHHTSFSGFAFGVFGQISSYGNYFEIHKQSDNDDYQIVTEWIAKNAKRT